MAQPDKVLSDEIVSQAEQGVTVAFDRDPVLISMLRCTVTNASGESAFAVCPDQVPNAASTALHGALAGLK